MKARLLAGTATLAAAVTAAGCGGGSLTAGTAPAGSAYASSASSSATSPPTPSPSTSPSQKLLAPPVKHPLDASKYTQPDTACNILVVNQLHKLGLSKPVSRRNSLSLGAGCAWNPRPGTHHIVDSIGVTWESVNTHGLSDIYAQRSDIHRFHPTTVQGYPGVLTQHSGDRKRGICTVWVGVNDHLAFFAGYHASDAQTKACPMAKRTASAVIDTLKKANK
jgi:hypothetical protein